MCRPKWNFWLAGDSYNLRQRAERYGRHPEVAVFGSVGSEPIVKGRGPPRKYPFEAVLAAGEIESKVLNFSHRHLYRTRTSPDEGVTAASDTVRTEGRRH